MMMLRHGRVFGCRIGSDFHIHNTRINNSPQKEKSSKPTMRSNYEVNKGRMKCKKGSFLNSKRFEFNDEFNQWYFTFFFVEKNCWVSGEGGDEDGRWLYTQRCLVLFISAKRSQLNNTKTKTKIYIFCEMLYFFLYNFFC